VISSKPGLFWADLSLKKDSGEYLRERERERERERDYTIILRGKQTKNVLFFDFCVHNIIHITHCKKCQYPGKNIVKISGKNFLKNIAAPGRAHKTGSIASKIGFYEGKPFLCE
jgi:hypothetical protein